MRLSFNPGQIFPVDVLTVFIGLVLVLVLNYTNNSQTVFEHESFGQTLEKSHSHLSQKFNVSPFGQPFHFSQRGRFWVAKNYAVAETASHFKYSDLNSITLTTQCDPRFLRHLTFLVDRWRGPISVAVYTPGSDFHVAAQRIHFLRECSNSKSKSRELIRKFVSFHLFFDSDHIPENLQENNVYTKEERPQLFSCSPEANLFLLDFDVDFDVDLNENESRSNFSDDQSQVPKSRAGSYRHEKILVYPINVARNIARAMSNTFLVLPSDVELYPSVDFIPKFLKMLHSNPQFLQEMTNSNLKPGAGFPPRLFVVPAFELLPTVPIKKIPKDKPELVELFQRGDANFFLVNFCQTCFHFPGQENWVGQEEAKGQQRSKVISIFDTVQRVGRLSHWEPFYVGSKNDPSFEERLTWEGRHDKHTQAFALCRSSPVNFPKLYNEPLKITDAKFSDLQDLKSVIPSEFHSFYNNLPHGKIKKAKK